MTTYWTVLALTYAIDGADYQARVVFPSMAACGAAMDAMIAPLDKHYDDTMVQCLESRMLSASIRPRARPQEKNYEQD